MEFSIRDKDLFSSKSPECQVSEHQSQLSEGSTLCSGPVQLMGAGSVGFVSPWTMLCAPTHVLKILGDAEFLADLHTTQEGLGREGLIRNCSVTHTQKMKSLLKWKCTKKLCHSFALSCLAN